MTTVGLSIYDWYRVVLFLELAAVFLLYGWALVRYVYRIFELEDESLRGFLRGQIARILSYLVLVVLFTLAVIERFGTNGAGRLTYNLIVQASLALALYAWLKVDLPRFRAVPATEVAQRILRAVASENVSVMPTGSRRKWRTR